MITADGTPLGDATGNTGHLSEHMAEGYIVPSLVYHALRRAGNTDFVIGGAFTSDARYLNDIARDRVRSAVRNYLYTAFGFAR